jgi:hypothetical protein
VLGLSIGAASVRAVLVRRGAIAWAGQAPYAGPGELAEVIARLAGEAGLPVRRARVVLERAVVQLRAFEPAPPLRGQAAGRWVALEAPRLFRKNGAALVTDAVLITLGHGRAALWAAAAPEPLLRTVLDACGEAGLRVESLGPVAEVLPRAWTTAPRWTELSPVVIPNGDSAEVLEAAPRGVWRSRLVRGAGNGTPVTWVAALDPLGVDAAQFAPAYAGAVAVPRLQLLPAEARAAGARERHRRAVCLLALAAAFWVGAGAISVGRLLSTLQAATRSLAAIRPRVDSALAARRDLDAGTLALATVDAAARARSRHLVLLAQLSRALDDSTYLVALKVGVEGTVRLVGYAPRAARVLAALERVPTVRDAKFESPVTRETVNGRPELDRFAIVARLVEWP